MDACDPTTFNAAIGPGTWVRRGGVTFRGGEIHTFTRVAAFGGGIVPFLNGLSGTPVVAPECTALEPDDFVAPAATYEEEVQAGSTQRFQCCIHPWMRTTVHTH
jgi:hypothetical protein